MSIHSIDPLSYQGWDEFVDRHPRASAFHRQGWLRTLSKTYGYKPVFLAAGAPGRALDGGLLLCRVSSWMTGERLVSLPFADHCEPLLNDPEEYQQVAVWLRDTCKEQNWKYVELRSLLPGWGETEGWHATRPYWFHELDITPSLQNVFHALHRDCMQRRILHAERARLSYEVGRSRKLAEDFYNLVLITRRRHQILPQPRAWFRNLVEQMGDNLQIRLARKDGLPVGAILTLRHRSSVIYKYGCSDARFHNLGTMPFLFWRLIEESKTQDIQTVDLGRSDLDSAGLITFKDRFGARKRLFSYRRCKGREESAEDRKWDFHTVGKFFSVLPDGISSTAGAIIYRHMG